MERTILTLFILAAFVDGAVLASFFFLNAGTITETIVEIYNAIAPSLGLPPINIT